MLMLVTGQPGHGKTAYALWRAMKLKKEGREVYAHGIKDLAYDQLGFKPIDNPQDWQSLPDGSVVVLDECYGTFPNRNAGSKVPGHVDAMARHRHRGFDFILIAQQGLQLDPFLRGLYEEHVHVKRRFGKATTLKRWSSYQGNVKAACSDESQWIRPNDVFQYYTSTVLNTSRLHVPMWLRWIAVLLFLLLCGSLYLKHSYESKIEKFAAENKSASAGVAGAAPRGTRGGAPDAAGVHYDTPGDYAKAHLPRFATMPWTAPVFDQRQPTADPQLLCMSAEAGTDADGGHRDASCTCLTEQGTRYDISQGECRRIARDGPVYNPYRQLAAAPQAARQDEPAPSPPSAPNAPQASAGAVLRAGQISTYGDLAVPASEPAGNSS
ncbi:zonular occludens toxin domain-containing protein [Lysobacter firmicutimachus]|uniref:Zonular occludens toxin domain-containing protein n=1 Tax=Lysobacter firmicutimachus TaxID=1792846 RepID=A0ABU8D2T8_9GAMM